MESIEIEVGRGMKALIDKADEALVSPYKWNCVDHVNGNTLDNRRENLRLATPKQNAQHRTQSSSGRYVGVTATSSGKWKALIFPSTGAIYLGTYETEEEAAAAYNAAARRMAGEFAGLNNVPDIPKILDALIAEKRVAIARLQAEISALTGCE